MEKGFGPHLNKEAKNVLKAPLKQINLSNMISRVIFGTLMLSLYLYLCAKNHTFIIIMCLILCCGITYEVISITKKADKPYPLNRFLIFSIASINISQKLIPAFALFYPQIRVFVQLSYLKPFLFSLYAISLVYSVTVLRRKTLKSQLLLLTIVHTSSYISGLTCAISIQNISVGKFFFVYPSLLVIANDIFAYFVGKFFGKTPLISLSPNKTVEGFIGGFIFTFMFGQLLSYLKLKGFFLPDINHTHLELPVNANHPYLNFPMMYLHNIAFVFAASFLAPFCGFIASAIKRSFQKKDFGCLIPGHGGLTDRFDCQILMVYFVYYYLRVIGNQSKSSANLIYKFLIDNLKEDDLEELCKILSK